MNLIRPKWTYTDWTTWTWPWKNSFPSRRKLPRENCATNRCSSQQNLRSSSSGNQRMHSLRWLTREPIRQSKWTMTGWSISRATIIWKSRSTRRSNWRASTTSPHQFYTVATSTIGGPSLRLRDRCLTRIGRWLWSSSHSRGCGARKVASTSLTSLLRSFRCSSRAPTAVTIQRSLLQILLRTLSKRSWLVQTFLTLVKRMVKYRKMT